MDQSSPLSSSRRMFEDLLADPEGKKIFIEAVMTAFNEMRGAPPGTFNIDRIGRLAACIDSHRYASQKMIDVPRFMHRNALLKYAAESISCQGPVLEFGVFTGRSINHLAALLPSMRLYGFDSFEGLPEAWLGGRPDGKRQFDRDGSLPQVRENVELVVGWFDRTLPGFLDTHDFKQVALLHIDCDLYSSTQTVLAHLHGRLERGTIIVFDEYFNYPTWERHEFAAFQEYAKHRQINYQYIGLVANDQQVAVRIL